MKKQGILYGIGVGPGDPELLTIKAVRILGGVTTIFASSSSKNGFSIAESIVRPHLAPRTEVLRLKFPMTHDKEILQAAWDENAAAVLEKLDAGQDVALLTLGDPLLYSTFGYVLKTVKRIRPGQQVEIIPGITSFQQAAAATGTILAEGGETLSILPGTMSEQRLHGELERADNSVVLKAYRNFTSIRETLGKQGLAGSSVFVSRLGLENELVCKDLNAAPDAPHYLSLLLVKRRQRGER